MGSRPNRSIGGRRQSRGGVLSHRDGSQFRWRQTAREKLLRSSYQRLVAPEGYRLGACRVESEEPYQLVSYLDFLDLASGGDSASGGNSAGSVSPTAGPRTTKASAAYSDITDEGAVSRA